MSLDWQKDWERITDVTEYIPKNNIQELKKKLREYKESLENEGISQEEIKVLVMKKFQELEGL